MNCALWVVYIIVRAAMRADPVLPKPQMRVMWMPGLLSGLLWSAVNVCQIYAVLYLGVGVGSGCVQAAIIVAGLWGIAYYREIRGLRILLWLLFVSLALGGIVGLSLLVSCIGFVVMTLCLMQSRTAILWVATGYRWQSQRDQRHDDVSHGLKCGRFALWCVGPGSLG